MIIPHEQLEPDTLSALLEEYVTRDGVNTADADKKIIQVKRQLDDGEVVVCFDEEEGSCNILPINEAIDHEANAEN